MTFLIVSLYMWVQQKKYDRKVKKWMKTSGAYPYRSPK